MTDATYITLAQAARLVGRPASTVRGWADRGELGRVRWRKRVRLVRLGRVRAMAARMDVAPRRNRNRPNPGRDPTMEELDAMIAEQMKRLPKWWWSEKCRARDGWADERKDAA